jgi:hypothetical protein
MKSATFFYLTLALVIFIFGISIRYTYQQQKLTSNTSPSSADSSLVATDTAMIEGTYIPDKANEDDPDPSIVLISSSTKESIHFIVETSFGGYVGYYSETAYRLGTSTTYFTDTLTEDNNGVCIASITFLGTSSLVYSLKEKPDSFAEGSCDANFGVGGGFLNGIVHIKR